MNNTYDVIIIWSWAAWLFSAIQAPFWYKKLLLEKTNKLGQKVLLSGWERANVSNIDIEATRDYFGQNKKAMIWILSKFNQRDIMTFFSENGVNIIEEDRWRLILESWDSRELLDLLVRKAKKNNCEIKLNSEVVSIENIEWNFIIKLKNWKQYQAKKVVVASWWKSFYQVWTEWDWFNFADDLWIKYSKLHKWLVWLTTKQDLKELSWISCDLKIELLDNKNKLIYQEKWPLLFTHFWISWPIVFNLVVALWELLWNNEEKYNDLIIKLSFDLEKTPKRIIKFFNLNDDNKNIELTINELRSWKEAKVTVGWILLDELTNNLESKKYSWLYFCWEILDLTGKTWWFNLQQAWSTGYIVGNSL